MQQAQQQASPKPQHTTRPDTAPPNTAKASATTATDATPNAASTELGEAHPQPNTTAVESTAPDTHQGPDGQPPSDIPPKLTHLQQQRIHQPKNSSSRQIPATPRSSHNEREPAGDTLEPSQPTPIAEAKLQRDMAHNGSRTKLASTHINNITSAATGRCAPPSEARGTRLGFALQTATPPPPPPSRHSSWCPREQQQ